ncbi:ubiquitin carboxyl-terminal hydrolase 37-like [Anguilla rostrata]|uniref:ubiquitin carboxyl-terminal hydrolase 37-like n=1 Tax=Anguilla rostrata TaxID=7938 RepID=UPI0030D5FBCA
MRSAHCAEQRSDPAANLTRLREQPTLSDCAEQPTLSDCAEQPTLSDCAEQPTLADCAEQPTLADCAEQPTLGDCAPTLTDCAEQRPGSPSCAESRLGDSQSQTRPTCAERLVTAEVKATGWFGRLCYSLKKFVKERTGEDETQNKRLVYTVLGLPNLRNMCYMNATLQSLFSLQDFMEDVRREESSHLMKCVAELHAARRCGSSNKKTDLLKTLKKSVSENCRDFCGHEQQDAHEFLNVLMSQMKEEGFILSTADGLHPYTCPVEANFEFDLLSCRTCLSCGETVHKMESYNSLSVDLVSGGSVEDSLALYFMDYEVECQCCVCFAQLAIVEQKLQSLPRVLVLQLKRFTFNSKLTLVKLQDTLEIPPVLSLQGHSDATATYGDCHEPSSSKGDTVPTAEPAGGPPRIQADQRAVSHRGQRAPRPLYQ